jgi:hypothetical protein
MIKLTGITLISLTPDPVSERSLSLSGSETNRASDLFLRIDFDRLCVSLEPSKEKKLIESHSSSSCMRHYTFGGAHRLKTKQMLINELFGGICNDFAWHKGSPAILLIAR